MAKLFPGGSSVTRVFPASLTAQTVVQGTSWTERYAIDWSEQTTYSFQASGAPADGIAGVAWGVSDAAKAVATTGIQVINGSGLELAPLTSAVSEWFNMDDDGSDPVIGGTAVSAPRVWAKVKAGLDPLYSSTSYTQALAFQAIMEPVTELSANHNEYGLLLTNSSASYNVTSSRKFDSSVFSAVSPTIGPRMTRTVNGEVGGEVAVNGSGEAAIHTFFEIVFYPGGTFVVSSSAATDFVEPLAATTFQKIVTTNTVITETASSLDWDADDMYLTFWAANEQAATAAAMKVRVKKFRLLTLGT